VWLVPECFPTQELAEAIRLRPSPPATRPSSVTKWGNPKEVLVRRPFIGLVAALAILTTTPAGAGAMPTPGSLDQSADVGGPEYTFDALAGVTQTITAGQSGLLIQVAVYCDPIAGGGGQNFYLTIGSVHSTTWCSQSGWLTFNTAAAVTAGQQFTIKIDSGGMPVGLGSAASDYTGGSAACPADISAIATTSVCPTDFAFKTYVWDVSPTTYTWSLSQVPAGASTVVSLTTQTTFGQVYFGEPGIVAGSAPAFVMPADFYTVKLAALPAWFTPSGVTCSAQIAPADCTLANYLSGFHPLGDGSAMTLTVTIAGTAAPARAAGGTTGTATGAGCITVTVSDETWGQSKVDVCDPATAGLGVGAAPATPAPTTTVAATDSDGEGQPTWLLLIGLALAAGASVIVARRRVLRRN
jgi:LPXTG-motif cell wall-anchored protein